MTNKLWPQVKEGWIIEIILGIIVLIIINFILNHLIKYFRRRALSKMPSWKEKLDQIVAIPLKIILWAIGIIYGLEVLGNRFEFSFIVESLVPFRNVVIICCLSWMLLNWKTEAQRSFGQSKAFDLGMIQIIGRLCSIAILMITAMIVLQILGLDIVPLVAFGGIGAAAIGFAAKDVIANFFGGMMLHFTRPFTVGDLILLPDRSIEGTVESLGWYLTTIRDKDKRPVYLPNAFFSTLLVINASRMSHRRLEERIGVRYQDFPRIQGLVEEIKGMLSAHSSLDSHLPIIVVFKAFNEYSLDIYIDAYCLVTRHEDFLQLRQEILFRIHKLVESRGAQMPFPTQVFYTGDISSV